MRSSGAGTAASSIEPSFMGQGNVTPSSVTGHVPSASRALLLTQSDSVYHPTW
jgi:hypothetical protein